MKNQYADKVLKMIPSDFGKSFSKLKKEILLTVAHGSSNHFHAKESGYSLFYTDNSNFMNGEKNGGGKGFYARLRFVGMSTDVKLSVK